MGCFSSLLSLRTYAIHILKILHDAHIFPQLSYCTPIWCNTYPTHLLPLIKLQKKIIRIVTNSGYFDHPQPLFKVSNILKLFDVNKIQIGIYMYKSLNSTNNVALLPPHDYPTCNRDLLRIPPYNLTLYDTVNETFTTTQIQQNVHERNDITITTTILTTTNKEV